MSINFPRFMIVLLYLSLWLFAFWLWQQLPAQIPVQGNAGQTDATGSRNLIFILPAIAFITNMLMYISAGNPQSVLWSIPDNLRQNERLFGWLNVLVPLETNMVFFGILYDIYQDMFLPGGGLPGTWITVGILLTTIIGFMIAAQRKSK